MYCATAEHHQQICADWPRFRDELLNDIDASDELLNHLCAKNILTKSQISHVQVNGQINVVVQCMRKLNMYWLW